MLILGIYLDTSAVGHYRVHTALKQDNGARVRECTFIQLQRAWS